MSNEQTLVKDLNSLLLDLVRGASQAEDFQAAMAACVEGASSLFPCDGTSLMWLEGHHLRVLGSVGLTAPQSGLSLPASQMGAAQVVLDSGRTVVIADVRQDARWSRIPSKKEVRAWLGAPLRVENRVLGLLEWSAGEVGQFEEADLSPAEKAALHVAPFLYQARLADDTRQRLRELLEPRLTPAPRVIDLDAELEPVVREAMDYAGARHAFVFLLGDGDRELRCAVALGDQRDRLGDMTLRGDGTLGSWGAPMLPAANWLGGGSSDREMMASVGIEKTLILPLRAGKEQVGMLGVAEPRHGGSFDRDAIRLMTHLASQASLLVEQAFQVAPQAERYDYEAVVRSSPLGIGVMTVTGNIRVCNPAMASLLSCSEASVVGRNLADFLARGDGRRLAHALEEVAITGLRRQVETRIVHAQAEPRHVRITLALAHISDDAGGNLVSMMEDITPLKILEQERVDHLRELREKHALLEELDQVKSRFVSNVSHELRTPLAVIKLYATLSRKGRPEKRAYYLQTIEQETHRLETMVENILDLTRMDRHSLRIHPELFASEEIIAQVLEVYEEAAKKKGIELRNHVQGALPLLWADKNHLIQLLTNLVDNALKYTPQEGQVWVAARPIRVDSKPFLEIAVGDTGVGIPKDEQEKVFDRFFRGSNNTPGSTGTGLGLAIVRELMVQHGGQVTVQSEHGQGSTFALQFPLPDPADLPDLEERT